MDDLMRKIDLMAKTVPPQKTAPKKVAKGPVAKPTKIVPTKPDPISGAIRAGNLDKVRLLLKKNPNVTDKPHLFTPLHHAAMAKNIQITETLIDLKADVNAINLQGESVIYHAIGSEDIVELLLKNGASPNGAPHRTDNTITRGCPLIKAAKDGHVKSLELLLEHKADVSARDELGLSALHYAVRAEVPSAVHTLCTAGADANASIETADKSPFMSMLTMASFLAQPDMVATLLDHGAQIDFKSAAGETALYFACLSGAEDCVAILLARGAALNTVCTRDETKHLTAFMVACEHGHAAVVDLIVKHEAALLERVPGSERTTVFAMEDGSQALHVAASNGHTAIVEQLLALGADVNASTASHLPPLFQAMLSGDAACVDALVARGADVTGTFGVHTALTFAIYANDEVMAARIVAAGADANAMVVTDAAEFPLPPLFFALSLDTYAQACELHRFLHTLREMRGFASKHANQLIQASFGGAEVDDDAFVCEMMDKMQAKPDAKDSKAAEDISDDDERVTRAMKMFDSRINIALVSVLLKGGADPAVKFGFNGVSPLQNLVSAVTLDNEAHLCDVLTSICETYSSAEARTKALNQRSAGGDSLMAFAIMNNTADVAKTLLKFGFDPNGHGNIRFTPNTTPTAPGQTQPSVIPAAAASEPDATRTFSVAGSVPPAPLSEDTPGIFVQPACDVLSPLLQAIRDDKPVIVELLVDAGVTVTETDLMTAAKVAGDAVVRELATALRQSGGSVDARDADGNTAVHHALMRAPGSTADKVVSALLQAKADGSIANAEGMLPVHLAVAAKRDQSLSLLLGAAQHAAASAMATTTDGLTPMTFAVNGGHANAAEILLKAGADPNAPVMGPMPALIIAVHLGHNAVVQTLLDHGADATAEVEGVSAITLAEMRGNTELLNMMTVKETEHTKQ